VKPQLVVLAGPNGAGKSTFYETFLGKVRLPFLNADLVEARTGIPSFEAARILDAMRDEWIARRAGFITETVFSDPVDAKLAMLGKAVDAGYDVTLVYIGIEPALCPLRIDQRVAAGGHDVPRDRIASRFTRSLENLRVAIRFVPVVKVYDNSAVDEPYLLVLRFEHGRRTYRAPGRLPRWAGQLSRRKPR
jgi:predicted ABC-type ATPase